MHGILMLKARERNMNMKKLITLCLVILCVTISPMTVMARNTVVWSLDTYLNWYAPEFGYPSGGVPAGTIQIIARDGARHLHFENRTSANQGIDARFGGSGVGRVEPSANDRVEITGRVDGAGARNIRYTISADGVVLGEWDVRMDGAPVNFDIDVTGVTVLRVQTRRIDNGGSGVCQSGIVGRLYK